MTKKNNFFKLDITLVVVTIMLTIIGLLFIYSSGLNQYNKFYYSFQHQIIWSISGVVVMVVFYLINYQRYKNFAFYFYFLFLILLFIIAIFSKSPWVGQGLIGIQPSEFSKLITILALALYLEKNYAKIKSMKVFIIAMMIAFAPALLVLIQPDLGTALTFFPIFLFMMFIAGADVKYVFFVFAVGILLVVFTVLPEFEKTILQRDVKIFDLFTNNIYFIIFFISLNLIIALSAIGFKVTKNRFFYWLFYFVLIFALGLALGKIVDFVGFLKDYQIKRLILFIDPHKDKNNFGYNLIMSLNAIKAGGFSGSGLGKGVWSQNSYIPEQTTDFIFSILSEEWGFLGTIFTLILYLIFFIRLFVHLKNIEDLFGKIIIAGIIGMFFTHFVVNVGMVIGLMPVTGIPLFFLSYGGSSLWTAMACIGIVMNINSKRFEIID